MPSPVTGDSFPTYNPSADACTGFQQLLGTISTIKTWFEWAFDSAGNWNPEAIQQIVLEATPVGTMLPWPAGTVPSGKWLICNGAAVSRATYPELFLRIGTVHGAGDGVTTFNLPDSNGRTMIGAGSDALGAKLGERTVTLVAGEMPKHKHIVPITQVANKSAGSLSGGGQDFYAENSNGNAAGLVSADITTTEAGNDGAHNNMQPSLALYYIIRATP